MNVQVMSRLSMPAWRSGSAWLFYLGVPVTIGFLLGSNKAGIANFLPWEMGVLYWAALSLGTWLLAEVCTRLVTAALRPWNPPWLLVLGVGFVLASLFNPVMLNGRVARPLPPISLDWAFVAQYLKLWSGIAVLWLAANYLFDRFIGLPRFRSRVALTPRSSALQPPRPSRPIALKAEDHLHPRTHRGGQGVGAVPLRRCDRGLARRSTRSRPVLHVSGTRGEARTRG